MYKKSLKLSLVLAGLLLLAAQGSVAGEKPAPGDAGPPPRHGMGGPGHGPGPGMIPPEKKDAFDAIMLKFKDQSQKLHQDMFAKQVELTGALAASAVDEGKVKALGKELNTLQSQLNDLDVERKLEMRKQGIPFGPYMLPFHGGGMEGHGGKGGFMPPPPPPPPAF